MLNVNIEAFAIEINDAKHLLVYFQFLQTN